MNIIYGTVVFVFGFLLGTLVMTLANRPRKPTRTLSVPNMLEQAVLQLGTRHLRFFKLLKEIIESEELSKSEKVYSASDVLELVGIAISEDSAWGSEWRAHSRIEGEPALTRVLKLTIRGRWGQVIERIDSIIHELQARGSKVELKDHGPYRAQASN